MFSAIRSRNLSCENEEKFIQDRIMAVERTVAELNHTFVDYTRKAASIRDKGEDIGKAILVFSEGEKINKTLRDETANFATCMSTISGYGNLRIININKKVLGELREYETICKAAKDEFRCIYAVKEKEMTRKKNLDRLRERNPRNRHLILQAETEVVKVSTEVARTVHNLEQQIFIFERQKISDLKAILLNFISVEMGYHARVIEVLTKAYNHIDNINEDSDLQDFKQSIRLPENLKGSIFRQSQSMGSLSTISAEIQPTRRASRNSPGINRHNLGIPKAGHGKSTGIQRARSQDNLKHAPKGKKDRYYDNESVSETETTEQQSVKANHSPFLAKHFTKHR